MTSESSNQNNGSAVAEQALQHSRTFLDRQANVLTSMLAERVAAVAGPLRAVGGQLCDSQSGLPSSQLTGQAANYTDRPAQYLRDANGERLIADAEHLAERNPVLGRKILRQLTQMVTEVAASAMV